MSSKTLLIIYDNQSYMVHFPIGTAMISSALKAAGHHVDIFDQNIGHKPDSEITKLLDNNNYEYVGIGVIGGYYQYRS